jgi:hypothetical protein
MSTLPMPLLSLLRKFISEISIKRRNQKDSRPRSHGVFASLLRAAAIPSLGYLFGWNTRLKAAYTSSDANPSTVGGNGKMPERNENPEKTLSSDNKPPSRKGKDETPDPKNGQQYDPNSPIYQLMNNPALDDPLRRPRNPIVLSHGQRPHSAMITVVRLMSPQACTVSTFAGSLDGQISKFTIGLMYSKFSERRLGWRSLLLGLHRAFANLQIFAPDLPNPTVQDQYKSEHRKYMSF